MSPEQRLLLLNQFEILSVLRPDDDYYVECRDILANGYEVLYSRITSRLSEPMSIVDGEFVFDVLQMYRVLNASFEALEDKEELTLYDVSFKGFDGNEEGQYYNFTRFLLDELDRFTELKESENFSYNSHHNMVEKYSRMLRVWKGTADRYDGELTAEQIRNIINS